MEQLALDLEPDTRGTWVVDMWVPPGMKRCCGDGPSGTDPHVTSPDNFTKSHNTKDGLQWKCRDCKVISSARNNPQAYANRKSRAILLKMSEHKFDDEEMLRCSGYTVNAPHFTERRNFRRQLNARGAAYQCTACKNDYDKLWNATPAGQSLAKRHEDGAMWREHVYEISSECHLCLRHVFREDLAVDHVIPLSKGGENVLENCRTAHNRCNTIKNGSLLENISDTLVWMRSPHYDPLG